MLLSGTGRVRLALLVCVAIGCAGDEEVPNAKDGRFCQTSTSESCLVDQRVSLKPEVPEAGEGIQFVSPEITIPAGQERQMCWVVDWVPETDLFIRGMNTYQGTMGHHTGGFLSIVDAEPGDVYDCSQIEQMVNLRPLVLPDTTYRGDKYDQLFQMPVGFAVRIPRKARLVMQSHYVNTSGHDAVVQDVVNLFLNDNPEGRTEAGYYILNDNEITIPPHVRSSRKLHCEFTQETKMFMVFGHMHEWGTSISIQRERDGVRDVLWNIERWTVDMRDAAPITTWDVAEPLTFLPGDRIHLECNYVNSEDHELGFPTEMCTALGMYWPADERGTIICDEVYDNE